jgi:hypothetical protein
MTDKHAVIEQIRWAFGPNEYPGDAYLLGSNEGCEPFEEVGPFTGRRDWSAIDAAFLDGHYNALCFFSEAGFRFFLPAYLVADLEGSLATADPLFHLTNGFHDTEVEVPTATRTFLRKAGGSTLMNPRRYGAMTSGDYARYRLSVFTRDEAAAIVAYLNYRRSTDPHGIHAAAIDAALESYWLDRAAHAPEKASLVRHVADEEAFVSAIRRSE